jgi:two-component system phosphate regulon sensor histidine kinase PhoR
MNLPFKIQPSTQAFKASLLIHIITIILFISLFRNFSLNHLGYFSLTYIIVSVVLENFLISYKKKEEQRSSEINILKDQENYRREFLGNVSHELKTPLFTIQGYILTLLEGAMKDKKVRSKYLNRTAKGVDRIISIVKDLDLITQFESGIKTVDKSNFNIYELIDNVYDLMEFESEKNNTKLRIRNEINNSIIVYADKERILQVLTNLVVNSIKYGKENGYTEIAVDEYDKDRIIVRVIDDGEGIEEEHLPRLFERFYRIDKTRSRKKGGSGLGLSIVKHIIEAHQEQIFVKSKVGIGTEFSFTLLKP